MVGSRAALAACFLIATLALAVPAQGQTELQGSTIGAIRFETDVPFNTEELDELIPIKVGQPLSIRAVQDSVRALFGTQNFRDVQVDATRSGMDVVLTFRLSIHYRIDNVRFEGFDDLRTRAQREMKIRTGDVLSLDAVDRSAIAIQDMLERRGFLEATVDPEVLFTRERNSADVIFHGTLGPPARIADIEFEGSIQPFTREELLDAMGNRIGKEYRSDRARENAENLERFLLNKGYRRADVRFIDAPYDSNTDTVRLRYRVTVGPEVRVEVAGVDRRAVRRWIPFRRNEGYSGDILERARDRIIAEYQRRGYFLVAVDIVEETVAGELVITYKVDPGQKYKLDDVVFEGNDKIAESELEEVITTSPRGGFRSLLAGLFRRPIGVTQEQLDDDRDSIEAYYKLHGFTEARVGQPVARGNPDGTLDVHFPIVEGPQTIVTAIVIEGNDKIPTDRLPDQQQKVGEPFNPQLVGQDLVALQNYYADRGFVDIQIVPAREVTPDKTGMTLRYQITEGPLVTLDEVIVQGNSYTDRDVILLKSRLQKGEPFSYLSLLQAQRNLYRLGIFSRVEMIPQRTGTSTAERDVTIQVDEGRNLTVSGSIGYSEEEGASGSVALSHRNLFGKARYAGVEALIAQRRERFALSYQEPFIFGQDIPTQLTVFRAEELRDNIGENGEFVNFRRLATFIEASRIFREQTEWSARYEYRIVECFITEPENPLDLCNAVQREGEFPIPGLPREDQQIQISSVTPTFFWDRRNDLLNPSRGFFASASAEYAFPLFRAKTNFVKGYAQSAWYKPITERSQFVVSGRLGLIEPLKPADDPDGGGIVPFAERFLAGGENTHRAFETDRLGVFCEPDPDDPSQQEDPDCQGTLKLREGSIVAIGGKALALVSAEYRFPIFASLRGAVFVDGGNVFAVASDVLNVGEFRWGVGTGLRYLTPIGPVRLDIGFKLDRREDEDPYATFLSLGYAF